MSDEPNMEHGDASRLDGRVAVVTGAGSQTGGIGNGRAAAILLARRGAKVALLDREAAPAEQTRAMIEAEGGTARAFACDVAADADCAETVAKIAALWGPPTILVNNVGVRGPLGYADALDLDEWDQAMKINVTSMMLMARHCLPHMKAAGGGSIVNISSVAGLQGGHPHLLYPTAKGAVVNMTRAMAAHHGGDGVRVNCVCPGMVFTPMVYGAGMTEERREARRKRSILQVEGSGWDVGEAVTFLSSDAARWITGLIMPVDAGATAGRAPDLAGGAPPS
ncbi:NAD(P)-dependent dehydrogenase, short-chain alcohol dehydrogenase family [Albimonas donghaensis]|uniref:NAD(P)-dependent dehydrogenase, short-chain alcohol dehydrogenase family n=1 Tax=Albimonas donghaensis TaxID=356660 RepID=A0A1H3B1M8_9RHOB|nr:SDR family oxidoreductase [Albimonas donghaensis]SDX35866.1 NAD(P)-dependent dehydrogenase, short-chain alcohol dehydrogenase family [Albimonas donghaensis]